MYPNLYYAFRDLFGVEWKALRFVNSFGFFVAIAFLAAAYVLTIELKRKQRAGLLQGTDVKIVVGKPASFSELLLNFVLGFLLGFKIVGLFTGGGASFPDPQSFIFSSSGNWPAGILLGIVFAVIKWLEKNKRKKLLNHIKLTTNQLKDFYHLKTRIVNEQFKPCKSA